MSYNAFVAVLKRKPTSNVLIVGILGLLCFLVVTLNLVIGANKVDFGYVSIDVDPTGKYILFTAASGKLYTLNIQTKKVEQIQVSDGIALTASYSLDGKEIVYAVPNKVHGQRIKIMNLVTGVSKDVPCDRTGLSTEPRFSPDGHSVAFVCSKYNTGNLYWFDYDLYLSSLTDGTIRQLTHERNWHAGPISFVDGGRAIVFGYSIAHQGETSGAMRIGLENNAKPEIIFSAAQPNYRGGAYASDLHYSRYGEKMTFISDRDEPYHYDVYVADSSGNNPKRLGLTQVSAYNQSPVFSADGKSIYVLTNSTTFNLYQIDLNGHAEEIADSSLFSQPETWKPRDRSKARV